MRAHVWRRALRQSIRHPVGIDLRKKSSNSWPAELSIFVLGYRVISTCGRPRPRSSDQGADGNQRCRNRSVTRRFAAEIVATPDLATCVTAALRTGSDAGGSRRFRRKAFGSRGDYRSRPSCGKNQLRAQPNVLPALLSGSVSAWTRAPRDLVGNARTSAGGGISPSVGFLVAARSRPIPDKPAMWRLDWKSPIDYFHTPLDCCEVSR